MSAIKNVLLKDKEFLQYFWDLASNDSEKRIKTCINFMNYMTTHSIDLKYTLARLIKGLGSSRESAREGFSIFLCEFLRYNKISIDEVLQVLDENSMITGSLKNYEERDFLFSKLFCYICIQRSGLLLDSQSNGSEMQIVIVDRVIELLQSKGWFREAAVDVLILLFTNMTDVTIIKTCLRKIHSLFNTVTIQDIAAWQLMLFIGLQQISMFSQHSKNELHHCVWQKEWNEYVTSMSIQAFSMKDIFMITDTLLASTHGYPKVHRVWDYLLSSIIPMNIERDFIPYGNNSRLNNLTITQEEALQMLTSFINKHLLTSSFEKRSVAFYLIMKLTMYCPADSFPMIVSEEFIQCMVSCLNNKKHTLHTIATNTLQQLTVSVQDSMSCKVAFVTGIIHYGGVSFDAKTGLKTVDALLASLDYYALHTYIDLLCNTFIQSIHNHNTTTKNKNQFVDNQMLYNVTHNDDKKRKHNVIDNKEQQQFVVDNINEDSIENNLNDIYAVIEALSSLSKNNQIQHRGIINITIAAVLVRIACFKSKKKKKSKSKSKSSSSEVVVEVRNDSDQGEDSSSYIDKLNALYIEHKEVVFPSATQGTLKLFETISEGDMIPEEVVEFTTQKLLSLLADLGSSTITQLEATTANSNTSTNNNNSNNINNNNKPMLASEISEKKDSHKADPSKYLSPTLLYMSWYHVWISHQSKLKLRRDVELEDTDVSLQDTVFTLMDNISKVNYPESVVSNQQISLKDAIQSFVLQVYFHVIATEDIEVEMFVTLMNIIPTLLTLGMDWDKEATDHTKVTTKFLKNQESDDDDENEEGDEQSNALMQLFEISLELLSISSTSSNKECYSTRGLRDVIKKLWQRICALLGDQLSVDIIDAVVSVVIGESVENKPEEEGETSSEIDEEHSVESEAHSNNVRDILNKYAVTAEKAKKVVVVDEDIMISDEQAMTMLEKDLDDDEFDAMENELGLEHTVEADEALASLIALKQQSRKQGLLQAQRQQFIVRSRAMDLLEIIVHKVDRGVLLFPMFTPLLQCLQQASSSLLTQNIAEGVTYTQRLQALIEQKLCKKKILLNNDNCTSDEIFEEYKSLLVVLHKLITSSVLTLRNVGHQAYVCITRMIVASESKPAIELLQVSLQQLTEQFTMKKNTNISVKFIEDILVNRLSDITIPYIWTSVISKISLVKHLFMRNELFKLVLGVLKKYNGLNNSSKQIINNHLPKVTLSFIEITKEYQEEKSDKKIKIFFEYHKEYLEFYKKLFKSMEDIMIPMKYIVSIYNSLISLQDMYVEFQDSNVILNNNKETIIITIEKLQLLLTTILPVINSYLINNKEKTNNSITIIDVQEKNNDINTENIKKEKKK